jgi:hypothetical protein
VDAGGSGQRRGSSPNAAFASTMFIGPRRYQCIAQIPVPAGTPTTYRRISIG